MFIFELCSILDDGSFYIKIVIFKSDLKIRRKVKKNKIVILLINHNPVVHE